MEYDISSISSAPQSLDLAYKLRNKYVLPRKRNQGRLEINHEMLLTGDEIVENNPSYLTSAYIQ